MEQPQVVDASNGDADEVVESADSATISVTPISEPARVRKSTPEPTVQAHLNEQNLLFEQLQGPVMTMIPSMAVAGPLCLANCKGALFPFCISF